MIVVIESNNGYTVAVNGQLLKTANEHGRYIPAHLTATEVAELRSALSETPTPLSTGAITPAKAAERMRPPIKRYGRGVVASQ